jgi:Uma2 family endonuclease
MGMPAPETDWTVAMVQALPDDGNRYEVIDGELLVSPAPSLLHQRAIARLHLLLAPYVDAVQLDILMAPSAVTFSARREVQPDLLVLPRIAGRLATRFEDVGVLMLAVEVLSPHSARIDRHKKRALYQDEEVAEYWIIDPASRIVERWRPKSVVAEVLTTTLTWQPLPAFDTLTIDLTAYFRAMHGE